MSESSDDGCLWIGIVLAGAALWWGFNHYKVVERNSEPPAPVALPSMPPMPVYRPSGRVRVLDLPDKTMWFLDADRVKGKRTERLAWRIANYINNKTAKARESNALIRFNCDTSAYQILQITDYDKSGKAIASLKEADLEGDAGYVIPDSNMDAVMQAACLPIYDTTPARK